MKRLLLTLLVAILSVTSFAQTTYEGFDIYGLGSTNKVKKSTFGIELGLAKEVEVGIRFQRNFSKYVSWDILQFKYAYDYNEMNEKDLALHKLSIMTGVRGFTPSFSKRRVVKFFASFDFGYGPMITRVTESYKDSHYQWYNERDAKESDHTCAMDFTLGLQLKKWHLAYGLNSHRNGDVKDKEHTLRIGLDF